MTRLTYFFDNNNNITTDVMNTDTITISNNNNTNDNNNQQHSLDSLDCQQHLHQEGLILQNASDLHYRQFSPLFQCNDMLFPENPSSFDDYSLQIKLNNYPATQPLHFNMDVNRNQDNMQSQIINNNNNNDDDDDDDDEIDEEVESPTSPSYLQQHLALTQLLVTATDIPKEISIPVTRNQQTNGIIIDKQQQQQQQHAYSSITTTSLPSLLNQKPPVYTKWTDKEDELLKEAVQIYGPHKWSLIATHVPNRTPMQCSARWVGALNPSILKGRWTTQEDNALRDAVNQYMMNSIDSQGNPQPIPWNKVSKCIPARTGAQCQARWTEALDPRIKKGKWSPEEDEILKEGVRLYGRCWIRIAEMITGRTQRQCRTRWLQVKNKQFKKKNNDSNNNKNNSGSNGIIKTSNNNKPDNNNKNNDNNNQKVMLTPPSTTPSTPAQSIKNVATSLHSKPSSTSSSLSSSPVFSSPSSSLPSPTSNIQGVIMRSSPTTNNGNNVSGQQQLMMINAASSPDERFYNNNLFYHQLYQYNNNQISFC